MDLKQNILENNFTLNTPTDWNISGISERNFDGVNYYRKLENTM